MISLITSSTTDPCCLPVFVSFRIFNLLLIMQYFVQHSLSFFFFFFRPFSFLFSSSSGFMISLIFFFPLHIRTKNKYKTHYCIGYLSLVRHCIDITMNENEVEIPYYTIQLQISNFSVSIITIRYDQGIKIGQPNNLSCVCLKNILEVVLNCLTCFHLKINIFVTYCRNLDCSHFYKFLIDYGNLVGIVLTPMDVSKLKY